MKRLLVGYKAADLDGGLLDGETTCHVLDIYHLHAIEKVFPAAKAVCTATLPEGPWDEVRLLTGPKLMSGELALDLLQDCHRVAGPKGRVVVDYRGRERDRNDLLEKVKDFPKRVRSFRSVWSASVPGGPRLEFASYPGCFCHRRLDEGGLALAETVCRDLHPSPSRPLTLSPSHPLALLDMGCGSGLVGLLVAERLKALSPEGAAPDLLMIDSHTRAIAAATENAAGLGIAARTLLSDDGIAAEDAGRFDLFVGNPPYYSDYRIAEVFLETAVKALKPGGLCYTVCKNAAGLEPVQKRYFSEVEIIARRGYSVLKSRRIEGQRSEVRGQTKEF